MTIDCPRREEAVIDRWNRVFEVLAAEPRRQLFVALYDTPPDRRVMLPEAAMSPAVPPDRTSIELTLRHVHLPLMERYDFIRWTNSPFRAGRGPNFEEASIVFDSLYRNAKNIPPQMVHGCHRLEREREARNGG